MFRIFRQAVVLVATVALASLNAQIDEASGEKRLLVRTLGDLIAELRSFDVNGVSQSFRSAQWLLSAAETWQPRHTDEGKGLRESLQLMLGAIRRTPKRGDPFELLMIAVGQDLLEKHLHCKALGLGAKQEVEVKTLRRGLFQVKGLEVWYLEKFLTSDPKSAPHRFRGFSSPVTEDVVPGRYIFWAVDPDKDRAGKRVEQRVGTGPPDRFPHGRPPARTVIEVLAP